MVILALLKTSGCALSMSALASHNSMGTACIDSPVFGAIDIAAAIGISAAIGAGDEHPGWYAVPGLIGLSGVIGVISAERCKGDDEVTASNAPPASNSAPSFGDAPVDPEARDAAPEEMGRAPIQATTPPVRLIGIPLRSPLPDPTPPPSPKLEADVKKPPAGPTCTLAPRKECPDGYYCSLVAENTGECLEIE